PGRLPSVEAGSGLSEADDAVVVASVGADDVDAVARASVVGRVGDPAPVRRPGGAVRRAAGAQGGDAAVVTPVGRDDVEAAVRVVDIRERAPARRPGGTRRFEGSVVPLQNAVRRAAL